MNQESRSKHIIDSVFVIVLLLLFLMSALTVIAIGANIYKKNVAQTSENYTQRVSFAYITEKVRQSDVDGGVFVKPIFGSNAIVMEEDINGTIYNTYIYCYEGYLMELFVNSELGSFYPQSGQKILKVNSFDVKEVTDGLISASISSDDGTEDQVYISVKSSSVK